MSQSRSQPDAALQQTSFAETKAEYKAGLDAANPNNRFVRRRQDLGGVGDRHLSAAALWYTRETARAMDRSDGLPGQLVEKLADRVMFPHFRVEPATGDRVLDDDLRLAFDEWAGDPRRCDAEGLRTCGQLAWQRFISTVLDGDVFALLRDDGRIQHAEADRCVDPDGAAAADRVITNGIELAQGVPVAAWLTDDPQATSSAYPYVVSAASRRFPFHDPNGLRILLHCYSTHRFSAHRGYTWWAPVMTSMGILDDAIFSLLLRVQNDAALAGVAEQATDGRFPQVGQAQPQTDGNGESVAVKANAVIRLPAGSKFASWAPRQPTSDQLAFLKKIVQQAAGPFHMPYCVLMLDASETNFSGYRGALSEARLDWSRMQQDRISQEHRPIYLWQALRLLPSLGETARRLAATGRFFRHTWIPTGWPYIEPVKDAMGDILQRDNYLQSPRAILAGRGRNYEQVARETIQDHGRLIELAIAEAKRLNALDAAAKVDWREVARYYQSSSLSLSGDKLLEDHSQPATEPIR